MISVIYPSRGRPERCIENLDRWKLNAIDEFELILSLDSSDRKLYRYYGLLNNQDIGYNYIKQYRSHIKTIVNPNISSIEAINTAAKLAKGDILIVISDDFDSPSVGWDRIITEAIGEKKDAVLKVFDGIQEDIITLPILTRAYYEMFGYIYFPEYKHLWADTEFTAVATKLRKVIKRNDIVILHNHHSVLGIEPDETYKKNEVTYEQGKKLYITRRRHNFYV